MFSRCRTALQAWWSTQLKTSCVCVGGGGEGGRVSTALSVARKLELSKELSPNKMTKYRTHRRHETGNACLLVHSGRRLSKA